MVIFRTILFYAALILCIRLMGKRQVGQMEPSEFVVTMLIANLAYPVAQGQIPPEQLDNARIHFALGDAAATVESVNYGVFRLVLLVLVIWALRQRHHVPWRGAARLWRVVVGVSLALSVPFALADPLRGVVDYAYPAFYTAVSAALAAAVVLVVQKLRRRG